MQELEPQNVRDHGGFGVRIAVAGKIRTGRECLIHPFQELHMMGDRLACELRIQPAVDDVALVFGATSSARASRVGGTVRLSVFAVLRLTARRNLVGCFTGKSAGFSPLRILPA